MKKIILLKWVRRIHLYSGLLLFPWVLLYGISAFLFNHPNWSSNKKTRPLNANVLTQLHIDQNQCHFIANAIHKNLLQHSQTKYNTSNWSNPQNPRLVGRFQINHSMPNESIEIRTDPYLKFGTLSIQPHQDSNSFLSIQLPIDSGPIVPNQIQDFQALLQSIHLSTSKSKLKRKPRLFYDIQSSDTTLRVIYDFGSQKCKILDLSYLNGQHHLYQFLMDLHTQCLYPGQISLPWLWALIVDLMSLIMCTWAITGLTMWWQIKRLRRIGLGICGSGLLIFVLLGISFYSSLGF